MKTVVALFMGFLSGLTIYFMLAMLFADMGPGSTGPSPVFVFVPLIGGWVVTTWLLHRGARSTNIVFRRGFLLGAAEWLAMAFVGVIFSGRAVSNTPGGSEAANAGAAIGGGIAAALAGAVSVFMAVVCLIGFAIAYFIGREMRDTRGLPTRKCPDCAEMIQADARKCRYCGAVLSSAPSTAGTI
jgi:hypothetical protein